MNEKDLLYFCKLVETGNYTLTANTFDVTQPTISMAIKRLADKFADPLILQKNRKSKITLTDAGELLYRKAKILLQDMASINYDVMHASDKKSDSLFLAKPVVYILPTLFNNFIKLELQI